MKSISYHFKKKLQMGIKELFSGSSKLSLYEDPSPLTVGDAIQQSTLEVDEKGSIGASTTVFSVVPLSISQELAHTIMVVDRPFIAMIVDRQYAVPYFLAKVTDPRQ